MYLKDVKELCENNDILMKRQTCFFSNKAPIMLRRITNFNCEINNYWYSDFYSLKDDIKNFKSREDYTYQIHFRYNTQDIIYYYFFSAINNTSNPDDSFVSLTERINNCETIRSHVLPKLNQSNKFDIVLKINSLNKEYLKSFASTFNKVKEDDIEEDELINIRDFKTQYYYSCYVYIEEGCYGKIKLFKLAGDSIVISDVIYSRRFCDIDIFSLVDIIPSIGKVDLDDFI